VRLIIPEQSDVPLLTWTARLFFASLLEGGVRIFSYQRGFCHAKTLLTDDTIYVGTTNLNHRSFFHDLEVDVRLVTAESLVRIERQFLIDFADSVELTTKDLATTPWWTWLIAKISLLLKAWL